MCYYEREEYECYDCDNKQLKLNEAQDFLIPIVNQLYNKAEFDLEHFIFCLDNLCSQLGVKMPDGDIMLQSPTPTNIVIDAWKKWNTNYLKSLTYTN